VYKFFFFVWLLFSAGLIYPDLERYVYLNELLAILGFFLTFNFYLKSYTSLTRVELLYFIFVVYGALLLLASYEEISNSGLYLSVRTMPIFYNVFGFITGYYLYMYYLSGRVLKFPKGWRYVGLAVSLVTPWRLSPQVFAMLFLKSYKAIFLYLTLFFLINGGSTSITAFVFVFSLLVYKNSKSIRAWLSVKYLYVFTALFFVGLYLSYGVFDEFISIGYEKYFALDVNLTWRYMFWVYLFQEVAANNIFFGIGFGSPLFELGVAPSFITSDDGSRNTEYTLGTHNSMVFLLMRMGGVGLLLILLIHAAVYSKAFRFILKDRGAELSEVETLLLANLMFLNSAFFNVILETPLYGGLYWMTLGLLYGSLKKMRV